MGSELAIILGRAGRDAEVRDVNGEAVANFSVAVDQGKDRNGQERAPVWYSVSVWGKLADVCGRYVKKGMMLQVQGRPRARAYTGKNGQPAASLDLIANSVQFACRAPESSGSDDSYGDDYGGVSDMDDIPF